MRLITKIKNLFGKKVKTENGKAKMIYAFTGVSGFKYYRFEDTMNQINFARYHEQFALRLVEMQNRITNAELTQFIETTRSFNNINQYRSAIEALNIRREIAMDTNMLYELAAIIYLREDEENDIITNELLIEKAKDIRDTLIKQKNSDIFFLDGVLKSFLTSQNLSVSNMSILMQNLEMQMGVFQKVMKEIQRKIQ